MSAELAIVAKLQDEASSGIRALKGEIEGLGGAGDVAAKGFANLQTVGAAALGALAVAAVAVGGAIASSIGVAADFQDQIAILSTAASGAGTSLDTLRDAALAVGSDVSLVGVSASGAADAMTILYKAGLTTGEIFGDLNGYLAGNAELSGALRAAIDGAAASELDMAQAAELAATTLATFGGSMTTAEERAEFVNVALNNFVQTADASVASVADLAAAMTVIGPTAAQFGFSLQETNTALALLSTRGIAGAEAGTALKSMFVNLMRPTDDVKSALSALHVSLYNADGTMRSMPQIIGDLSQALYGMNEVTTIAGGRTAEQNRQLELAQKSYDQATDAIYKHNAGLKVLTDEQLQKYVSQQSAANAEIQRLEAITGTATTAISQMTEEQRNQYIQTLAGSYGMKAMAVLLMEGTEGWTTMATAIANAATIQEVAAARTQTFSGAMEALSGVVETIRIGIGSAFLPVLEALVRILAELAVTHMTRIVDAFEAVGTALSGFFDAVMKGTPPITALGDAAARLAEAFGMPAEQAALLKAQIEGVLTAIGNVIGPIVQAITSFVSWKDVLITLGIAIASVVIPAVISIVTTLAPIIATVAAVIAAVAALRTAWERDFLGIRSAIERLVETVGRVLDVFAGPGGLFDNLRSGEDPVSAFLQLIMNLGLAFGVSMDTIAGILPPLNAVGEAIQTFFATLQNGGSLVEAFSAGLGSLRDAVFKLTGATNWGEIGSLILDKIGEAFRNLGDRAATAAANILNWISTAVNSIDWNAVGTAIVNGIAAAISGVVGLLVSGGTAIVGFFSGFFTNESLQAAGTSLVTALGNAISGAASGISTGLDSIRQAIFDWAGADSWLEMGQTIIDKIAEAFRNLGDKVAEVEASIFNWIADAINGIEWHDVGESIINGIVAAITAVVGLLVTAGTAIVNYFVGFFTNDEIGPAGENLITALGNAISEFASGIGDGLASVRDAIFDWAGVEDWSGVADKIIEMIADALGTAADAIAAQLSEWQQAIFDWAGAEDWSGVAEHIAELIGEKLGEAKDAIAAQLSEWQQAIFDWAGAEDWLGVAEHIAELVGQKLGEAKESLAAELGEWRQAILDWADAEDWLGVAEHIAELLGQGLGEQGDAVTTDLSSWQQALYDWADTEDWTVVSEKMAVAVGEALSDQGDLVTEKLGSWIDSFTSWVESVDWYQVGHDIMFKITDAFLDFKTMLSEKINTWLTDLQTATEGYTWYEIGAYILMQIVDALMGKGEGGGGEGADWNGVVGTWVGSLSIAVANIQGDLQQMGRDIVAGIAAGIAAAGDLIRGAIAGVIGAAEPAAREAAESQSPSRLMMPVGSDLSAGVAVGILQGGSAIISAISQIAGETEVAGVKEFGEAMEAIADAIAAALSASLDIGSFTGPGSGWEAALRAIAEMMGQMVEIVAGSNSLGAEALEELSNFVDVAGEIGDLLVHTADVLSFLAYWTPPDLTIITIRLNALAGYLEMMIAAIAELDTEAMLVVGAMGDFIDSASGLPELFAGVAAILGMLSHWTPPDLYIITLRLGGLGDYLAMIVQAVFDANQWGLGGLAILSEFADTAGAIVEMLGPLMTALLSIAGFVAPPPDVFLRSLAALAGMLSQIMTALAEANTYGSIVLEGVGLFAETAAAVAEMIVPLLSAIMEINAFGTVQLDTFHAGVRLLVYTLRVIVQALAEANTFGALVLEAVRDFAETGAAVADMIGPAIDAMHRLNEFGSVHLDDFHYGVKQLAYTLRIVAIEFLNANTFGDVMLAAVKTFAETSGVVAEVIGPAVDAMHKLNEFGDVRLDNFHYGVAQLAYTLRIVVIAFIEANTFGTAALEQARVFAEAAGEIIGVIGDGIEAMMALGEFEAIAGIRIIAMAFAQQLAATVLAIVEGLRAAGVLANEAIVAAAEMSGAIGDVLGVVSDGIEALAALANFEAIAGIRIAAMAFAQQLAATVLAIVEGLRAAGVLSSEAIIAAGDMAGALSDVLGVVEDGIEALAALANFEAIAGIRIAAMAFAQQLAATVLAIVEGLRAAGVLSSEAIIAAGDMAGALEDLVGVIQPGIEAITALAAYTSAAGLVGKAQQFTADLVAVAQTLVSGLTASSLAMGEALARAGTMSDSLTGLFDIIKPGVEALTAIAAYTSAAGLVGKAQQFTADLVAVATVLVTGLTAAATQLSGAALAAAAQFAAAVGEIVTQVKDIADNLGEIGNVPRPDIGPVLAYIVASATQISTGFGTAGDIGAAVGYAAAFRANLEQLVKEIQAAVAALAAIAGTGTSGSVAAALAAIAAALQNTEGQFAGAGKALAEALITALAGGIGAGQGQVWSALEAVLGNSYSSGLRAAALFGNVGKAVSDFTAAGVLAGQSQVVAAVVQVVGAAIAAGLAEARKAAAVGQELIRAVLVEVNTGRGQLDSAGASAGAALIAGMVRAIAAGKSSLVNAIKDAVTAAVAAAKAALGIASPSKVGDALLTNFMQTAARAALANSRLLAAAVDQSMSLAVSAAADRLARAQLSLSVAGAGPALALPATTGLTPRATTAGAVAAARPASVNIYGDIVLNNVGDARSFLEELDALRGGGR